MNQIRPNFLGAGLIGAGLIAVLAMRTAEDADVQLALLAIGGAFLGSIGTALIRLVTPDPEPTVPESVVQAVLARMGHAASTPLASVNPHPAWTPTVLLCLVAAGAGVVLALTGLIDSDAAIVAIAGSYVGGLGGLMGEIIKPPANPDVPESIVLRILDVDNNRGS